MIVAVTHNAVDLWFVGLAAVSLGCAVAAGALLANGWRRTPVDPWAEAVAVERARTHGRKVRARRIARRQRWCRHPERHLTKIGEGSWRPNRIDCKRCGANLVTPGE